MRTTIDSMSRSSHASLAAPLLLVLAALLWGSNFVVGRLVGQEISPVALSFWRWLGALAELVARHAPPLSPGEAGRCSPNLEDVFLALTGRTLSVTETIADEDAAWLVGAA